MTEKKINFPVNNKFPVEIVQVVETDNTWNESLTAQEQAILAEFGLTEEDNFYEAELIAEINNSPNHLAHQPIIVNQQIDQRIDPKTNKPLFFIKIELNDCYFTDAKAITSFLWFHDKFHGIELKKVEQAKKLLRELETNSLRIVDSWGLETSSTAELKEELIVGLRNSINQHSQGEVVISHFEE